MSLKTLPEGTPRGPPRSARRTCRGVRIPGTARADGVRRSRWRGASGAGPFRGPRARCRASSRCGAVRRQAAPDRQGARQYAPARPPRRRAAPLDDEQRLALRRPCAAPDSRGSGYCDSFQHRMRTAVGVVLHHVVVGDAAGDDASRLSGPSAWALNGLAAAASSSRA